LSLLLAIYELQPLEILREKCAFKAHGMSLDFLVTKILGGDSFIHKNENKKRPRNQSRVAATPRYSARVRQWWWWWWEKKKKNCSWKLDWIGFLLLKFLNRFWTWFYYIYDLFSFQSHKLYTYNFEIVY